MDETKTAPDFRHTHFVLLLLLAGIAVRLLHVTQPYIDVWSWRQSDVASIAENFYNFGYDFLRPQINWGGNVPGYVGTEFPLVPFLAAILYPVFGVQDWIGRSISILFFAVSVPYLYALFRKYLAPNASLFGVIVYVFLPVGIFSSRSFMADTPALCLTIAGLFHFSKWLDDLNKPSHGIASFAALTLAMSVKPSSFVMVLPAMFMAYQKWGWGFLIQMRPWILLLATLLLPALWYSHARKISFENSPYSMFGKGTARIVSLNVYWHIVKQTAVTVTIPVTFLVIAGTILGVLRRRGILFLFWFASVVAFVIVLGAGNKDHPWYRLPFLPVAAALSGLALEEFHRTVVNRSRLAANLLLVLFFTIFAIESYRTVRHWYRPSAASLAGLGQQLRSHTSWDDLIIMVDHGDPTGFYYAKRKGWHFLPRFGHNPKKGTTAIRELEKLRKLGATHIAFPSTTMWWLEHYPDFAEYLNTQYKCTLCTSDSAVYRLREN